MTKQDPLIAIFLCTSIVLAANCGDTGWGYDGPAPTGEEPDKAGDTQTEVNEESSPDEGAPTQSASNRSSKAGNGGDVPTRNEDPGVTEVNVEVENLPTIMVKSTSAAEFSIFSAPVGHTIGPGETRT